MVSDLKIYYRQCLKYLSDRNFGKRITMCGFLLSWLYIQAAFAIFSFFFHIGVNKNLIENMCNIFKSL